MSEQRKRVLWIASTFSPGMLPVKELQRFRVQFEVVTVEEARELIKIYQACGYEIKSCVGHPSTASVLSQLLGVKIEVNRAPITLEPGDAVLFLQLLGRPGKELDVATLLKMLQEGKAVFMVADLETEPEKHRTVEFTSGGYGHYKGIRYVPPSVTVRPVVAIVGRYETVRYGWLSEYELWIPNNAVVLEGDDFMVVKCGGKVYRVDIYRGSAEVPGRISIKEIPAEEWEKYLTRSKVVEGHEL
ncbi:MAG: DUF1874 domain-containing protein [Deltaproteobacteria bacterium]|nr:DUF1874 domain-containing protein [Deltaproteobacteria bacterium]